MSGGKPRTKESRKKLMILSGHSFAGQIHGEKSSHRCCRLFHNLTLVISPKRYDFVLLPLGDLEFGHRITHVFHGGLPIALRDAKAFVRTFHVAPRIKTRAASQRA